MSTLYKILFLNTLLLLLPFSLFSQSKREKADTYFEQFDFDNAIDLYESIKNLNIDGQRNLARSYHNRHRYVEAEEAYSRFIHSEAATVDDYFNYSILLRINSKHDQTKIWMEKILEKNPDDLRAGDFFENEENIYTWLIRNPDCSVINLDFNDENDDFGVVFYKKKQMIFTSTRQGNRPFLTREYTWNKKPYLSIFEAGTDKQKQFIDIHFWNKKQNKKWHEGPISFNKNHTFAAFNRNNYSKSVDDNTVRLEIYFTQYKKGEWSKPEPFHLNNPAYSVGHPALSKDGKMMFFVSDMPGGYGGSDIYYSLQKKDGTWGEAINAGRNINTEGNEEFPFYDSDKGLLFFASNGRSGLGGFDIFVASRPPCCIRFDKPENMGTPINSSYDDFSIAMDKSLRSGYFSSNRPIGKGGDDIYRFTFRRPFHHYIPVTIFEKNHTDLDDEGKGMLYQLFVINKTNKLPIINATVELGNIARMETNDKGLVSKRFENKASFQASVNAMGYKQEKKSVSIVDTLDHIIKTDTIYLSVETNKQIVLKNIYYDFDKSNILSESAMELDKVVRFLKNNPTVTIELSSHTDSRGTDEYNLRLSDARAQSAVNYILSKGITKDRITAKGYGESRPFNSCVNGAPCSERKHRENRRTEIFISGYGDAQSVKQTKGKY